MKITINSLNVNDGDAIIVNLVKNKENLVFLIDGGHSSDFHLVIKTLEPILKNNQKKAPDFIICTHYDDDHIGGLFDLVKHYGPKIKKVWIHKTSERYDPKVVSRIYKEKMKPQDIFPSEESDYLIPGGISSPFEQNRELVSVLKSMKQEIDFLELLKSLKIKCEEPIAGCFRINGWPELKIIGPSFDWYNELFPKHFDTNEYINGEVDALRSVVDCCEIKINDPFETLDSVKRTPVTPTNLNSAILLITCNSKKFLFTGDAGIRSFTNIPDYTNILNDLFWLKVPHHASKNNIDSNLIRLFKPTHVLISGDTYISKEVVDCLVTLGSNVRSTKEEQNNIVFEYSL
jgi:beta-lactamase superfamily II metal-dependent hydrolase